MKFNKVRNFCGRGSEWLGRAGRSGLAMLLVLVMIAASLPVSGVYSAYAEGASPAVSGSDTVDKLSSEEVTVSVSAGDAASDGNANIPAEDHICVIRSFAGHVPGEPVDHIVLQKAVPLNRIRDMLPKEIQAVIDCEDCPAEIKAAWKNVGSDRLELVLDEEKYSYEPLDDPETEDIDESTESPWCDLPFIAVTVEGSNADEGGDAEISSSDVTSGSDATSDADVTPENGVVSGADVVTGSDVTSGSDIVSGGDAGENTPADDKSHHNPVVSGSDTQILPLCTCESHCYANTAAGLYLVNIKCPVCSADPSACLVDPERADRVLEVTASDGRVVTVSGALPESAALSVEPIEEEAAAELLAGVTGDVSGSDAAPETTVCFAYDIKVIYEGREFQPSDFGETVTVSIHDIETAPSDVLTVYHFHEDEVECLDSERNDGNIVSFETDGFSYYVGTAEKTGAPSTVYVYRYRVEEGNTAAGRTADKMYFYCDENGWLKHTNELLNSNKQRFSTIGAILTYFPDADITFVLQGTYIVNGSETIDGTGRNITIIRHATHSGGDENGFDVGYAGKSLTLKNVTLDGNNRSVGADQAMVKAYNSGAVVNIEEGTVIKNCNSHGVLIMTNSTVNMKGGTITNCYAKIGDTKGAVTRKGGGVYVDETSTFNMSGGTISNCSAKDAGGGVYIAAGAAESTNAGKMTMTGGTITGCSVEVANAGYGSASFYGAGGGIYIEGATNTAEKGIGRVAPFATLTMSGGTISGNTAENGAGIANSGILTLSGGTISGNTAVDSGGGICNTQTMTMTGGSILNNTAQNHSGGGMILYGYAEQSVMASTVISGGTISGNSAPGVGGLEGGDGIMVYNYTTYKTDGTVSNNFRHHLMMTGKPTISDVVSLGITSDSGERDISLIKSDNFDPGCVIKLALWIPDSGLSNKNTNPLNFPISTVYNQSGNHSSGEYTISDKTKLERVLSKFTLVNPQWYLKLGGNSAGATLTENGNTSYNYHIVVASSAASFVYFDRNAASGGDGTTPAKAINNMSLAYDKLKANGGTIYMVSDYVPSGIVNIGVRSYAGEGASVTTGGDVQFKRYVKPSGSGYTDWKATNSGSIFTVNSGNTLSLAGVTVDGHNSAVKHQSAQFNADALTTANSAMISVASGGNFTATGYTRLIDAPSSTKGGAIYAADGAVVNINDKVVFSGNSGTAAGTSGVGECVYVGGNAAVVTLSGGLHTNEGDFHLATAESEIYVKDSSLTTEDGVLDITLGEASHCYSGRVVAVYNSDTPDLAELLVSNHEIDSFNIKADGSNVILPGYTATLTAAPEDVTLSGSESGTFDVALADVFEIFGKDGLDVSLSADAGTVTIVDSAEVDSNRQVWGTEDARTKFGLSAQINGGTADAATGSSVAVGSADTLTVAIHNANAIVETKEGYDTITLDINVGGYVRTYTVTLNIKGGAMSVTVPLKIIGVADTNGTIYMPTPEAYQITNNSSFPVEVTDIEWRWESGASDMFANVNLMSSQVKLDGSADLHSFAGNAVAENITDGRIGALAALGLDWDMFMGTGNYIRSATTRHVATITYTIDAVKD